MTSQNTQTKSIELLHIDDDRDFLEIAERFITATDSNINIHTLADPEKTLETIKEEDIDVVLCDYRMPEMDGIKVLEKMKDKFPDVNFMILTGKEDKRLEKETSAREITYFSKNNFVNNRSEIIEAIKQRTETE